MHLHTHTHTYTKHYTATAGTVVTTRTAIYTHTHTHTYTKHYTATAGTVVTTRTACATLEDSECEALAEVICEQYGEGDALSAALGERDKWLDERIRAAICAKNDQH